MDDETKEETLKTLIRYIIGDLATYVDNGITLIMTNVRIFLEKHQNVAYKLYINVSNVFLSSRSLECVGTNVWPLQMFLPEGFDP